MLTNIGCKLKEVEADGNCLFRALSDQMYGTEEFHSEIRKQVVDFIEANHEEFQPFMEDEEPFDHYCTRMREDGTWGGNQEVYAAARHFRIYIVIHQENNSRMLIECDQKPSRIIHICYHDTEHYDSIRMFADPIQPDQAPQPITLDIDGYRLKDFEKKWQKQALQQHETRPLVSNAINDRSVLEITKGLDQLRLSKKEQRKQKNKKR